MKVDKNSLKKLAGTKGMGFVVLGVIAGLILLLMPSEQENEEILGENTVLTSAEYCSLLEEKAESLILQLPNVEECSVFITMGKGYRYIYATDQKVQEQTDGKTTEKLIVLAGNGNGESPLVVEEIMPEISGVAIVCANASYETQYKIVSLVCALFDIPSNRISVQT